MHCLMIINMDNNADITSVSMCRERWVTLLFPQLVFFYVWLPRPAHPPKHKHRAQVLTRLS